MKKALIFGCASLAAIVGLGGLFARAGVEPASVNVLGAAQSDVVARNFDLEILVGGRPLEEYYDDCMECEQVGDRAVRHD